MRLSGLHRIITTHHIVAVLPMAAHSKQECHGFSKYVDDMLQAYKVSCFLFINGTDDHVDSFITDSVPLEENSFPVKAELSTFAYF